MKIAKGETYAGWTTLSEVETASPSVKIHARHSCGYETDITIGALKLARKENTTGCLKCRDNSSKKLFGTIKIAVDDRFWSKVEKGNESKDCWNWVAAKDTQGYGRFYTNSYKDSSGIKRKKFEQAHRYSFKIEYGDIPVGLFICHKCDNPNCVRPTHLFAGTPKDNSIDALSKGRLNSSFKPGKMSFKDVHNLRIPQHIVDSIKIEYNKDTTTHMDLSKKYRISARSVSDIVNGRWCGDRQSKRRTIPKETIKTVLELNKNETISQRSLARQVNITQQMVSYIIKKYRKV